MDNHTVHMHPQGTSSNLLKVKGFQGEIFYDTTEKSLRVQDGSTLGGTLLAKDELATTQKKGLLSSLDKQVLDTMLVELDKSLTSFDTLLGFIYSYYDLDEPNE